MESSESNLFIIFLLIIIATTGIANYFSDLSVYSTRSLFRADLMGSTPTADTNLTPTSGGGPDNSITLQDPSMPTIGRCTNNLQCRLTTVYQRYCSTTNIREIVQMTDLSTCSNPGPTSACVENITPVVKTTCGANQRCNPQTVACENFNCTANDQCPPPVPGNLLQCNVAGNTVQVQARRYVCNNPGPQGSCDYDTSANQFVWQTKEVCAGTTPRCYNNPLHPQPTSFPFAVRCVP